MKRSKNNHMDESEVLKRKTLNAAKRRKKMAKYTYVFLCIFALLVVAFVIWSYMP